MLLYCDAFCAFELLYFEYPIGLRHLTLVQVPQVGISSQGIEVHQSLPVQPLGVSCVSVCGGGFWLQVLFLQAENLYLLQVLAAKVF